MPDKKTYTEEELTQALRENAAKLPYALRKHIDIHRLKAVLGKPDDEKDKKAGIVADVRDGSRDTVEITDPETFMAHPYQLTGHEVTHLIQNGLSPDDYKKMAPDSATDVYNYGGTSALESAQKKNTEFMTMPSEHQAEMVQYALAHEEHADEGTPEQKAEWQKSQPIYNHFIDQVGSWNQTAYPDSEPIQSDADPRLNIDYPAPDVPPKGMVPPPEPLPRVLGMTSFATNVYGFGDPAPGEEKNFKGQYSQHYLQKVLGPIKFATPKNQSNVQPKEQAQSSVESILGPIKTAKLPAMVSSRLSLYSKARANGYDADKAAKVAMETAGTVSSGLNPERESAYEGYAESQAKPAKQTLTPEQDQTVNVAMQSRLDALVAKAKSHPYSLSISEQERYNAIQLGKRDMVAKDMTAAYAYAKSQGWSDAEAENYAGQGWQQRVGTRLQKTTGQAFHSVAGAIGNAIGRPDLPERLDNPFLENNAEARKTEYRIQREATWLDRSSHLGKLAGTLDTHLAHLIGGFTTASNIGLIGATEGLGVGARGGIGLGETADAEKASEAIQKARLPVSVQKTTRTIQSLVHAGFTAQLAQGSTQSFGAAAKNWKAGNKSEAVGYMMDGLVNGLMAYGGVHESVAHEHIKGDLKVKSQEVYGKDFGDLNDSEQAVVISKLVEDSPEYQKAATGSEREMKKNARILNYRHNRALAEAWNPNAAARAIRGIHEERSVRDYLDRLKSAHEERLQRSREERPSRKQGEVTERTQRTKAADDIAGKREQIFQQRNAASESTATEPQRHVEAVPDEHDNLTYPANYWGEESSFGVSPHEAGFTIYRQTPRGVEWMNADGNFEENPEVAHFSQSSATADTIARLSSLSATADSLAESETATPEDKKDAEKLESIRRDLVSGEISPKEAQKQAGIAEKSILSDETTAARDGKLNGPYHGQSRAAFYSGLEEEARSAGMSDADVTATLDHAGLLARQETENNLHHVYQPGDYVVSKSGTTWTLDSKGLLHPSDGGQPVPLMKNGLYSNDAMQLAQSGRVGYGTETREERRAAAARKRDIQEEIRNHQEEMDKAMRLAQQREGLETAAPDEPRADFGEKQARQERLMSRRPRTPEGQIGQIVRMVFKAPSDAQGIIHSIAEKKGTTDEEVMRLKLAADSNEEVHTRVADLEIGNQISDPIRKDKPWKVEKDKNGQLYLRSGQSNRVPLDRLNPSETVLKIVERGTITSDKDVQEAAFGHGYYIRWQQDQVQEVKDRTEGKQKDPEPRSPEQAAGQVQNATRRSAASESVAAKAINETINPQTDSAEKAEQNAEKATEQIKVAEQAYAQEVEAQSKTVPQGDFPQRAPASVGLLGVQGVVVQNSREIPFHYELLPLEGILTSHVWNGSTMEVNPEYPGELQPRTISEAESKANAMKAERGTYDFRQYADPTITGSTGPAIVDMGGRTVGGNTRLAILRKHIENLKAIADPEEREAAIDGLRAAMKKLAHESGITSYPDDGQMYAVTRMLEKPIETKQEAAELGRLFNKPVSVQMGQDALGVSYANSLDDRTLEEIARRVDAHDGIAAAIAADPQYFTDLVRNRFGVDQTEDATWFEKNKEGVDVLHTLGREQFVKTMLGTVIKDSSVLSRLKAAEDSSYRAIQRGLGYIIKMRALPDFDISTLVEQALNASVDTSITDPGLSRTKDKWSATYHPDQQNLVGMEVDLPPEPNRVTEVLWRALHASDAAVPRTFNDRLKSFLGEETAKGGWLMEEHIETPLEAFNRAFAPEIKLVQHSRGDAERGISQVEWDARDRELSDQEREGIQETKAEPSPILDTKGPMEAPPEPPTPEKTVEKKLAVEKKQQGYVTPQQLRAFLDSHSATRGHAAELYRTADMMARFVLESDPHEGVEPKDALAWVLKERLAGIEAGELKTKRGQYSDANLEKNLGSGILKLHQAADPSTFIHEFAHVIFPLLSDEDMRLIDTIHGPKEKSGELKYPSWDGTRKGMDSKTYTGLSEKLAHGLEQFLRDENPTGFTGEVKAMLGKVKDMMRKVYMAFTGDPLSDYKNTEESREVFAKMFGITDFDVQDNWREEVKKTKAEEKRMKKPSEELHPIVTLAKDMGANGIQKSLEGKVEDSIGQRVNPKKPTAVLIFRGKNAAIDSALAWTKVDSKNIENAELVESPNGERGIRFNTKTKIPPDVLYQELPEKTRGEKGLEIEKLKKEIQTLPDYKQMHRLLFHARIARLENEIRASYGVEPLERKDNTEVAAKALEEVKHGKTDSIRTATHGVSGVQDTRRTTGVPKPPQYRVSGNAGAGQRGVAGGRPVAREGQSLAEVKPVNLEPLRQERAAPVGVTHGEPFDQKAWVDGLKRAGLPENAPAPTWALDPKTAEQLIFPGQKQVVQLALSALEQGDGAVIATATGSGKTYTAMAAVKEWRMRNLDAKILVITKNAGLLKSGKEVAAETFGFHLESDIPDSIDKGVFGATYQRMLNNKMLGEQKWDLVVADESGEARRWYAEDNKQGKALKSLVENSKKAIYLSATPFHSPMEYGYLDKLNLWPKGQFDKWIEDNFAHEKINDRIVAKLDPSKQAKLRQQLIERGQLVSQAISYDGYTAHFGVVPVTDGMKRSLDRIHEGFARARSQFISMGKKGMAEKAAAFEATYTKSFLERARIPEAIELARKAREQGWQVLMFSETSADDLFRRERVEGADPSTYQQLDDAMGGQLSKIIPPFANVYEDLHNEFGDEIADYSGRGNTMASRDKAKSDFMSSKAPMLYTTYAAGGIGVSLHDTDGDKPRVAIFLGPPYSGVLLEQAMGRTWRFGVKSDTHAVFLATDSEPDIRLMQQKVGPRMRALRAAVLGERDSLASAMSDYTDDEKVRARQNALAYSEGDEVKVNAASFTVRNKSRNVGINDWSTIQFPTADSAKNKGMKYGEEVTGGNWSSLYQEKFGMRPPDTPEEAKAKNVIDEIGNLAARGKNPAVENLDPADRKTVTGLAAATATVDVQLPVEVDKQNAARQSMEAGLQREAKFFSHIPYHGMFLSSYLGIENIANLEGMPRVGKNIARMGKAYEVDWQRKLGQDASTISNLFHQHDLKLNDQNVNRVLRVVAGKDATIDPSIRAAADDLRGMFGIKHDEFAKAGIKVLTKDARKIPYSDFPQDPYYAPSEIDWDHQVTDPANPGRTLTLGEIMKPKFDEAQRQRVLANIPELKRYSPNDVYDYLARHRVRSPLQSHIQLAKEIDFPFVKYTVPSLFGYFRQAAIALSKAENFGVEDEKLNAEIRKLKKPQSVATINSMFEAKLRPQVWDDWTAEAYKFASAYEIATKMTWSFSKLPFHLGLGPLGMRGLGGVRAFTKAGIEFATHPHEVMEQAAYSGAITRQIAAADFLMGEHESGVVRKILRKEGFEALYRMDRVITSRAARIFMDQKLIHELKRGGDRAEATRRLLEEKFLIGPNAIDEAIANGRFSEDDMQRGSTAFTNATMYSADPLEMPHLSRLEISPTDPRSIVMMKRALRTTWLLKSFSAKTLSRIREDLFDEMVVHHNFRMLPYLMLAAPAAGNALVLMATGIKDRLQKGLEKMEGVAHRPDSFEKHLAEDRDFMEHPTLQKAAKWEFDGLTLTLGQEALQRLGDAAMDIASGHPEKATNAVKYAGEDFLEDLAGSFFTDMFKTGKLATTELLTSIDKKHPETKAARGEREALRYLSDQVPALKQVPWVEQKIEKLKKESKPKRQYY